jgi:hypothetical protein
MSLFERPTLPPLTYQLWLPECAAYVRETDRYNRRIIGTVNRARAMQLPEPLAIAKARALIRSTGRTVELRLPTTTASDAAGSRSGAPQ